MMRSVLLVCATFLIGIISIYGSAERDFRADFCYVNPSGVHTLDPARMSWTQDFRLALNLWQGLTSTHPKTTEPIEGAAGFPPQISADGLTYTFTIHEDARWSNGDRVKSHDFIRGWRRGMEPGTATDYSFLFSDHITGTGEYVRWRLEGVAVLTALSRLRDGWGIDANQARVLANDAIFEQICEAAHIAPDDSDMRNGDVPWQVLADQLSSSDIDWTFWYDRIFEKHISEFEERFNDVGVHAVDDQTLAVELTRPCPYFLDLTAFPSFLPCHNSIELLRERYRDSPITAEGLVVYDPQWTKPDYKRNGYPGLVTNGPYKLADWTFKRRVRLAVNPHYRAADDINCRTVDMLVFDNISASLMAYEAGDVDFLPGIDVPYDHEIARLSRSGERPDFHLCDVLATYFFNFNCVSKTVLGRANPFVDARVRKAFSLAVDKKTIVNNVLGRGDRVAYTFVPSGVIKGYDSPTGLNEDVDQARRLLSEAGYPEGDGLPPIELLYVPADERVCQAVARMWESKLGVRIDLRSKESKTFAEDKANHRYMIARGNWYADYNDPTTFLNCLITGNGNNDSGYSNPQYDALIVKAEETVDSKSRAELLQRAEQLLVESDFPILPILHYAQPIAIKPYVGGLYPNARMRFPFQYITVER
jgi:oligopeptide transport system substrate-binding protein